MSVEDINLAHVFAMLRAAVKGCVGELVRLDETTGEPTAEERLRLRMRFRQFGLVVDDELLHWNKETQSWVIG